MRRAWAVSLCLLAVGTSPHHGGAADGFKIEWSEHGPVKLGGSHSGSFWRPRGGVDMGRGKAVVRVQVRGEGCRCGGDDAAAAGDVPACAKACGAASEGVRFTLDAGATFHAYSGDKEFCGAASVRALKDGGAADAAAAGGEEGKVVRHCADASQMYAEEDKVTMPVVEWELHAGGVLTGPSLTATTHGEKRVTVQTKGFKKAGLATGVVFGESVLDMPDKKLMFRVAKVSFAGEPGGGEEAEEKEEEKSEGEGEEKKKKKKKNRGPSVVNALLKSQDDGYTWVHASNLPLDIGTKNALERTGENNMRVVVKTADYEVIRTSTKTLGRKWDDVQVVEEYYSLPTIVQTRFATHLGGGRAGPSLYSIGGKKSGDPKYANLANIHNAQAPDADDFQENYVKTFGNNSKADVLACRRPPFPSNPEKCHSSGLVDVVSLGHPDNAEGAPDTNRTNLLVCYDRLNGGFNAPADAEDSVYCMRAQVDEEAEATEADEKRRKREEREKNERDYREKLEQRAEELRKKRESEKKNKKKKHRERREAWVRRDLEENVAPALRLQTEDGDLVIVRDLTNAEDAEFIEDSVGVPEPKIEAKEEESA